jgi:hypothetical protein
MRGATSFVGRRICLGFAKFFGFLVTFFALTAVRHADGSPESSDSPVQFAVLSDLHFNPFLCANKAYTNLSKEPLSVSWVDTFAAYETGQDTAKEKFGQDSSYRLINLALQNLTMTHKNLAFVLCTGDLFAHEDQIKESLYGHTSDFSKYRSNYVVNSEAFVARMMRNAGLTNVFPTLGNNDAVGDYAEPSPTFLKALSESWEICTPQGLFGNDFQNLGCYEAAAPGFPNCRILSL